mmetsp:Transcript_26790/g.82871  ORF Transcript_26790/g.82871 Transcript_26790/m.82871 type:complete len:201 (-) Transcript_26790:2445-3047(-)
MGWCARACVRSDTQRWSLHEHVERRPLVGRAVEELDSVAGDADGGEDVARRLAAERVVEGAEELAAHLVRDEPLADDDGGGAGGEDVAHEAVRLERAVARTAFEVEGDNRAGERQRDDVRDGERFVDEGHGEVCVLEVGRLRLLLGREEPAVVAAREAVLVFAHGGACPVARGERAVGAAVRDGDAAARVGLALRPCLGE